MVVKNMDDFNSKAQDYSKAYNIISELIVRKSKEISKCSSQKIKEQRNMLIDLKENLTLDNAQNMLSKIESLFHKQG